MTTPESPAQPSPRPQPGFSSPFDASLLAKLPRNWGWLLALGILMVVLGVIGFGMLGALTLVNAIFFGALLLVAGVAQVIEAFREKEWGSFLLHLLVALLYVVAGLLVVYDPILASLTLTLLIAITFIAVGIARLVMAVQMRGSRSWGLVLFSGLISVLLGILILAKWPASGFWVLGLFVAVELISQGVSCIALALTVRRFRTGA